MKRAISALAAIALTCAVVVPAADAHTVKYETTVTAKVKNGGKDAGTFSGTVESTSSRCVIDREVKLYQHVDNAADFLIGSDRTDDAGGWEFIPPSVTPPGSYYALASKTVLKKNAKHRHVCKRAASKDVTVK